MKQIAIILSVVSFIATTTIVQAQSLAEIAEKERQRREEISETPTEITNVDLEKYTGGSVSTVVPIVLPSTEPESEESEDKAAAKSEKPTEPSEEEVEIALTVLLVLSGSLRRVNCD